MNLLAEIAEYWADHLWSASLQIALLVPLVYAISFCFRRFPARYRYALWLFVLARLAIPTSITSPLGISQYPEQIFSKGIQWVSKQQYPTAPPLQVERTTFPETQSGSEIAAGASLENPAILSPTGKTDHSVPLPGIIWLSGVLVFVFAISARVLLFRRRARLLHPTTNPDLVAGVHRLLRQLNIKRPVRLLDADDSDSIQFPSVHGILRPTIIMPAGMAAGWTTDDLEPLLLHELTHIKRRDCLVNFAQIMLQVLYFYHPMVWFTNWIIRREREFACDDDVVRHSSGCPTSYVRSMLRIAETAANQRRHQLLGIAMADNFSNLGRRIRRMMNNRYRASQRFGPICLGTILILGLLCAAVSAQGPERPEAPAQVTSPGQESPDVNNDNEPVASSGVLEPASEDRIQTEAAHDPSQSVPDAPVVSMLHQEDNINHPTESSEDSRPQIRTEILYDGDKLVLTSDRQVRENKTLRATGNVVITLRGMVITSDEAKYDEEACRGLTSGQTRFSQNNVSLICSRAEFDFDAQTSTFYDASGSYYDPSGRQFFFSAGIVRKSGDNKFQMYKDAVTYERLQPAKQFPDGEILPIDQGISTKAEGLPKSVVPPAESLFETGSEYLEQSQYIKARLAFQTLINMYPDSDLVMPSYLAIGDAYHNEGGTENLLQAEDQYTNFIIFYPNHPHASEAQMKIISAQMKRMRSPDRNQQYTHRAEQEIKKFLERFPDSEYVPIVRQFLGEVQKAHADKNRAAPSHESSEGGPKEYYKKWLNEDVAYIILKGERDAFLSTTTDKERESFIAQFWLRRDPTPETLKNEFKEEHYNRIAYANEHYVSNIAGWKTDRGRVYIMYGKPDQVESHPTGGYYARPAGEGGGSIATFPFEKWRYRHIDGLGSDIEIEFVDSSMSGEYRMAISPDEKRILRDDGFFGPLQFGVRTDYMQQSPDGVLVRITIELNNKELEFKKEPDLNRATVNVHGIVTSITNRIMAEWEDEIVSEFPDESFENGQNKRSTYQRMITLPPGQRYKLDLVLKDISGKKAGTRTLGLNVPKYESAGP